MKKVFAILFSVFSAFLAADAQTAGKTTKFPAGVPVKETGVEANGGAVEGRKYSNKRFGFSIAVPDNWFIAGRDFETVIKDKGYDLSVDDIAGKANRNIEVLMTAFTSAEGLGRNAIMRVTAENLKPNPQIRDAVDYLDAITAAFMSAKLPSDFSYTATNAERLGTNQYAFLDTKSSSGKKRLYATVRMGHAIMFTLSYSEQKDLDDVREILRIAEFSAARKP